MLSSIGIEQLKRLETRIKYVISIYEKYRIALAGLNYLKLIPVEVQKGEIPIYIEVLCPERKALVAFLASYGIETRPFYRT